MTSELVAYYMAASVHPALAAKYAQVYPEWKEYARTHGIVELPARPVEFANFISDIAARTSSLSYVQLVAAAVDERHLALFHDSPIRNLSFKRLMRGIRRHLSKEP